MTSSTPSWAVARESSWLIRGSRPRARRAAEERPYGHYSTYPSSSDTISGRAIVVRRWIAEIGLG